KLRIAAVVQQGELGRIVEASPKDFKELLNSLIGIDRLDKAYSTMSEVIRGFEEKLRDETGFLYSDIPRIEETIKQNERALASSEQELAELARQNRETQEKISVLESEIDRLAPLQSRVAELQRSERMLVQSANEKSSTLASEIARLDRLA